MTTTTGRSGPPSHPSDDRLRGLQRAAGIGGLVAAATYVVGFAAVAGYLAPRGFLDADGDPAASLAFLLDNQVALYAWYLVLYVVGGVALVSLVLGVGDRLRDAAPGLVRTAGVFGHVWAGLLLASGLISLVGQLAVVDLAATDAAVAVSTWSAVSVIQDALGGGIEIVGAVWALLVGLAGIRSGAFSRGLGGLAIAIGAVGVWTLVPSVAGVAGALFGLALIVWFTWAGVSLLAGRRPA